MQKNSKDSDEKKRLVWIIHKSIKTVYAPNGTYTSLNYYNYLYR